MLGGIAPSAGTGGYVAGSGASEAAVTSASVTGKVKNKDAITLVARVERPGVGLVIENTQKTKARADGDDIISLAVAQKCCRHSGFIRQNLIDQSKNHG